ncbi:MAG: hypothetical protein K6F58_07535 [Bacteroidales bacterium]|nr:hypothetical protein [Bacteroidales bacterium]
MKFCKLLFAAALAVLLSSCDRGEMGYSFSDSSSDGPGKVLVLYSPAASNLASYISGNLQAITKGQLPGASSRKTVLVFAHFDDGPSYLRRLSADEFGNPVSDTLYTVAALRSASDPAVMTEVLGKVCELYPPENNSFTLILSSHGTGWLPAGAIAPDDDDDSSNLLWAYSAPQRKTFGIETVNGVAHELTVQELADAIPMKLECLVFDACLMGGVEVAYQLRNKVHKLCCSPAEVPGPGYIYTDIGCDLLSDSAEPEDFGRAFFEHYDTAFRTGAPSSDAIYGVTSTTVDCTKMEPLADICRTLFQEYRDTLSKLDHSIVQHYYRVHYSVNYYRAFFDLEDMLVKAGITEQEHESLKQALDACITFKGATPAFMKAYGGFTINNYSGLSMYLPKRGNPSLDAFYKTLDWNIATNLVE